MFGKKYRLTKAFGGRVRDNDRPAATQDRQLPPVPVGSPRVRSTAPVEDRVTALDESISALDPYLREEFTHPAALVNPLLVVWDAAQDVDPGVSCPVEELLTDLLHRTTVATSEIVTAMEEVRARAVQVLVLEGCSLFS